MPQCLGSGSDPGKKEGTDTLRYTWLPEGRTGLFDFDEEGGRQAVPSRVIPGPFPDVARVLVTDSGGGCQGEEEEGEEEPLPPV